MDQLSKMIINHQLLACSQHFSHRQIHPTDRHVVHLFTTGVLSHTSSPAPFRFNAFDSRCPARQPTPSGVLLFHIIFSLFAASAAAFFFITAYLLHPRSAITRTLRYISYLNSFLVVRLLSRILHIAVTEVTQNTKQF